MFGSCSGFTSLDLSTFDTSKVTNMSSMFYYCSSLTSLDVSSFDISKVTNFSNMFGYITTVGLLKVDCDYEDAWENICITNRATSAFPTSWDIYGCGVEPPTLD